MTIDVKAVKAKVDWLMGGVPESAKPSHFIVLVSYEGQFTNTSEVPRCWILRHGEILPLIEKAGGKGGMRYLSRKRVLTEFEGREGAWHLLSEVPA